MRVPTFDTIILRFIEVITFDHKCCYLGDLYLDAKAYRRQYEKTRMKTPDLNHNNFNLAIEWVYNDFNQLLIFIINQR